MALGFGQGKNGHKMPRSKTMDRKIYVEVKVRLIIRADEGVEVSEIIQEMDYNFVDKTGKADIEDMEIRDFEVTDSK
jgi:hypothetical protein